MAAMSPHHKMMRAWSDILRSCGGQNPYREKGIRMFSTRSLWFRHICSCRPHVRLGISPRVSGSQMALLNLFSHPFLCPFEVLFDHATSIHNFVTVPRVLASFVTALDGRTSISSLPLLVYHLFLECSVAISFRLLDQAGRLTWE